MYCVVKCYTLRSFTTVNIKLQHFSSAYYSHKEIGTHKSLFWGEKLLSAATLSCQCLTLLPGNKDGFRAAGRVKTKDSAPWNDDTAKSAR